MATARRSSPKPTAPAKSRAATARRTSPPKLAPVVNEAMRARYAKLIADFQRARGEEIARWDAAYETLGEILGGDPPLYLAGGFKSASAFVAAALPGMKLETVRDYVRVAQRFSPDDEKRHGVTKLAALLDYLEAKNGGALPDASINPDRTKVEHGREAVPFASLSVDEVRDAARTAKRGRTKRTKENPAVAAMRARFAKGGLGNVTLTLTADRWTFGRVETRQLEDLGAILVKAAKQG